MPNWVYSYRPANEARAAKAMAWDIPVHPKVMTEVARAIKGMRLLDAEKYLRSVIELKEPVPFRSASKKVPHKEGTRGQVGVAYRQVPSQGRQLHVKAA